MSGKMRAAIRNADFSSKLGSLPPMLSSAPVGPTAAAFTASNTAFVRTHDLNLRTEASDDPSTIILSSPIGEAVGVIGDATTAGWKRIVVDRDDRPYEGVVFAKHLRDPNTPEIENILATTYAELFRLQLGRGGERADPFSGYVEEMWINLGIHGRDGRDSTPWSAAFISWVVNQAGYEDFNFSALYSKYIHQAIRRRELSLPGPFWGYRLEEAKPALGDLVCQYRTNRDANGNEIVIDYDYAEDHSSFFSHCDIVVQINERSIRAIGGNTGKSNFGHRGSVAMKSYRLDNDRFLLDENRLFALMKNNLGH